jgi:IclR family transcriptional regulator, acetate operon repressor
VVSWGQRLTVEHPAGWATQATKTIKEEALGGNGTQAIDRAAELLSRVVLADVPPGFATLVSDSGLPKSTASRLLQALERHRLVLRDHAGGYAAGPLFAMYASRHDPIDELVKIARPVLERVGEATGETVNLAVAHGDAVVQIAQVDSTYLLGTVNWVDVEVPPHCSALGKVFFAAGSIPLPDALERRTPRTVTSIDALARQLDQVRSDDYAVARGELEIGLDAVAAPVPDAAGGVVAALGVSGPSDRIGHQITELGELLIKHAGELSEALGHPLGHHRKGGAA